MELYLSLGTNLGDRERNLEEVVERLDSVFGKPCARKSETIETEPWGFVTTNECFLNSVVMYEIDGLTPEQVLDRCQAIEVAMGRAPHAAEWDAQGQRIYHSRLIDIDLLLYGKERVDTGRLQLPHPLMKDRGFVMVPLLQIVSEEAKKEYPEIFE